MLKHISEAIESLVDERYTQEHASSEYVRSHEELEAAKIRKPRLDEGIAFREKIPRRGRYE